MVAMNRVDVVELVVDLVDVDLHVGLVDVDLDVALVDVDLDIDVDLVDVDLVDIVLVSSGCFLFLASWAVFWFLASGCIKNFGPWLVQLFFCRLFFWLPCNVLFSKLAAIHDFAALPLGRTHAR